jgi:uncharacterized protein YqgV (UPF0045/DUF77 family)
MFISAQVSIYPLRQTHLSTAIDAALTIFREHNLEVTPGPMSTVIAGEDEALFGALKLAFQKIAAEGYVVMSVSLSNACPVPSPETKR